MAQPTGIYQAQNIWQRVSSPLVAMAGLLLALYALISAVVFAHVTWLSGFVIGGTLWLAYLNQRLQQPSILTMAREGSLLVKTLALYALSGLVVELVGNFWLRFWDYPLLSAPEYVFHLLVIQYPLGFAFLGEAFTLVHRAARPFGLALFVATLINAFLIELPNTYAPEWRYHIPLVSAELLGVNVVVIAGWAILIAVPLIVKRVLARSV